MRRVISILVVASAALFAFIFGNEADEFPVTDVVILLIALAGILLVQSAVLLLVARIAGTGGSETRGLTAAKCLTAFLIGANAYYTAFITYDSGVGVQVALAVGVGVFFLVVLFRPRLQDPVLFVASTYFLLSLGLYAYTRITMRQPDRVAATDLRVRSRRNVYLIGNESLSSPKAFREVFGLTELPHVDYLKARGFRVLDSAYSADYKTLRSYSRLLDFGQDVSEADITKRVVFNYPNTTFSLFHKSGYRIQWLYKSTYFMLNSKLVDFAYPPAAFYQCEFVPRRFFYVLCRQGVKSALNRILFGFTPLTPEIVQDRVRAAEGSGQPWLTIYHTYFPNHTLSTHSYDDPAAVARFRARYRANPPEIRKRNFEAIVDYIRRTDPTAVIVTFGDHGPALTRGADLDKPNAIFTQRQILEDHYGVMLAVYPKNFCTNRISEGTSTNRLVENVVRCLNGDDRPTPEQRARDRTIYWKGPRSLDRYAR